MLICIGFQSVAATSDTAVPVLSAVVKPPDVGAPGHFSPPSIVSPASPLAGPPVSRPAMGIVQSPVMTNLGSSEKAADQALSSMNGTQNASAMGQEYAPDRVIVKFKTTGISGAYSSSQVQAEAHAALGASVIADSKTLVFTLSLSGNE